MVMEDVEGFLEKCCSLCDDVGWINPEYHKLRRFYVQCHREIRTTQIVSNDLIFNFAVKYLRPGGGVELRKNWNALENAQNRRQYIKQIFGWEADSMKMLWILTGSPAPWTVLEDIRDDFKQRENDGLPVNIDVYKLQIYLELEKYFDMEQLALRLGMPELHEPYQELKQLEMV